MYEVRVNFGPAIRNNDQQFLSIRSYLRELAKNHAPHFDYKQSTAHDDTNMYDFSYSNLADKAAAESLAQEINSHEELCAKLIEI